MPLILLVGGPCSGKTKRAFQIKDYLEEKYNKTVTLINEDVISFSKVLYYKDSVSEQMLRAALKSTVEKQLDQDIIVILDYMNYIKGYRYELYCLCRSVQTTLTVIYTKTPIEICEKFNELQDKAANPFPSDLLLDFYERMEEPNPKNRWDKPLFIIIPEEKLPLESIARTVLEGQKPKQPISTKSSGGLEGNLLYEVDTICKNIVNQIITEQNDIGIGGFISFEEAEKSYNIHKIMTPLLLAKAKQDFLSIMKTKPPKIKDNIKDLFIQYLNMLLEQE